MCTFQGQFCHLLNIACPDEADFHASDLDGNGIVTMQEYIVVASAAQG